MRRTAPTKRQRRIWSQLAPKDLAPRVSRNRHVRRNVRALCDPAKHTVTASTDGLPPRKKRCACEAFHVWVTS